MSVLPRNYWRRVGEKSKKSWLTRRKNDAWVEISQSFPGSDIEVMGWGFFFSGKITRVLPKSWFSGKSP